MERWTRPIYGEELVEGRQHRRFRVHNGGFAALYNEFTALGQIIDISRGGLSFRYVASEARTYGSAELRILMTDGSFCFEKVPFKTIWDCSTPQDFSLDSLTFRHCGVQFGKLGDDQKFDLKYFIENCTTDKAES